MRLCIHLVSDYDAPCLQADAMQAGIFRYAAWLPIERTPELSAKGAVFRSNGLGVALGLSELWVAFSGFWPERQATLPTGPFKDLEAMTVLARYAAHQTHLVLVAALAFAALVYVEFSYGQLGLIQALSAKPAEGPIRVLACAFVFQIVRLVMTYGWAPIRTLVGWFLLPLGQNSLYAYAMHIGLIAAMWIPAEYVTRSESWNTLLQLGTAVIVWGMIKWKAGYSVRPTWVLRRRPQAVADAADRLDEPRRTHVDLAAQVANVHVNRVTGADPVISPHTIQNDLPRQDLAGVRHEQLEQIEFARAQLHRRAIAADGPGDAIQ